MGNFPPQPAIFPDYPAPIVRNTDGGPELAMVRWGMPGSSKVLFEAAKKRAGKIEQKSGQPVSDQEFKHLLDNEPDRGVTNVRNTSCGHWRRWLDETN